MGTVALTLAAYALAIGSAPAAGADPARALTWLLFIGSSAHVASTGWFSFLPQVRGYARTRPRRYLIAPAALVAGTALVAAVLAPQRFVWLLLVFFAWQFFHFQKQNLGLAALAGVSHGVGSLDGTERGAIMATGIAGIAGLLWHPELLQLGYARRCGWVSASPAPPSPSASPSVCGVSAGVHDPSGRRPSSSST